MTGIILETWPVILVFTAIFFFGPICLRKITAICFWISGVSPVIGLMVYLYVANPIGDAGLGYGYWLILFLLPMAFGATIGPALGFAIVWLAGRKHE